MFGYPGDAEGIHFGPDGNDQNVIRHLEGGLVDRADTANGFGRRIQGSAGSLVIAHMLAGPADRLHDAPEFQGAHRGAGQKRGEKKMVSGADPGDIVKFRVHHFNQADGAEAGTKYEQAGFGLSHGVSFH